ncbi:penicillin-binding transpeptidase domain-containing protein [Marvinbryantia formatexigens DSM 14469]|nr:penicillin-binding transpeptidase domain-containing protein [Marvinbryantia formatexigens]UWO23857.1 penicillin-binding transpeptidase domain-containing protein [Marvinbryantia formatexigens DSM 14469]SDG50672.1 stage V sporulation protein D (sporulation-specific penicillin-binding protein) [Marvinbryantia formatexigens]
MRLKTFHKKKVVTVFFACVFALAFLAGRLIDLMLFESEYYAKKAQDLHERERDIKAARGKIIDACGNVLATNQTVCTISVIHSQIEEPERVIQVLTEELGLPEETVRARVEKRSSIERIKTNVAKETGDKIREMNLAGVKVDEDFKRWYPYGTLASKVLGFTGGDNQGIIGLEVKYEDILKGSDGKILTLTDARGVELPEAGESRLEPVPGNDLYISLDANIQKYAEQAAEKVMEKKSADRVSIIIMRPSNGEILAMTDVPEFDLNNPFELNIEVDEENSSALQAEETQGAAALLTEETQEAAALLTEEAQEAAALLAEDAVEAMTASEQQDAWNRMWRNGCINDTYEPGSTFKIITASAGLEAGVVSLTDQFSCPGFKIVEDRKIRCHKVTGHGSENFVQGAQNSCNPVFIEVGLRLGVERYYSYFEKFGLLQKTGIDLPGEAATIMHKMENMGQVELATVSFGQSFQITPLQLITTVSSLINGGRRVTPHFGVEVRDGEGALLKELEYPAGDEILSEETSETLRYILEQVVDGGSGKNAYLEGYHIGGKTATSETLPRSANKYISSFIGFAPADDPQVIGLCVIHNPQGVYYGGTIAAPVIQEIFANILPYLGIEKDNM